jgi:PAS domain S-box-containing protein
MQFLRNVVTGGRLLLAPTSLLGVLAVLLGIAFWGMRLQDNSLDKALHEIVQKTDAVASIKSGTTTSHAKTYRILTHIETHYPKQKIAEEIVDVRIEMNKTLGYLVDIATLAGLSDEERQILKTNHKLASEYQTLMQDTLEIAQVEIVQGVVFMMQADKKFVELTRSLDLLQKAQDRSMEQSYTAIKRTTNKILGVLLVVGIGALILFFSRMLGRSYTAAEEKREVLQAFNQELETRVEQRTQQLEAQVMRVSALNHSMAIESAEREKAEEKYRAIFEHATEGIFQASLTGRIISANLALANIFGYDTPEQLQEAVSNIAIEVYTSPTQYDAALALMERDGSISQYELAARRKDGAAIWVSVTARLVRDAHGTIVFYEGTMHEVTGRKLTETALYKAQADLVTSARQAGMAEIASNVLHNVGNVLNSVNISASLVNSKMRESTSRGLVKAVQMMDEHGADLGQFLTQDDKGKLLPAYLSKAVTALTAEQRGIVDELESLTKSVDHIKDIVAMQQSYAGATSIVEPVQIRDLLEDALRMNATSLARHQVVVVRDFAELPVLLLDKPRLLQILVNLISNAKQATDGVRDRPPQITLRVEIAGAAAESRLRIQVEDEGEGIAQENLARIFAHGFTTRKNGHGFGLHSCALAAQAMGGTLVAHSDGAGTGATFTLDLPIKLCEEMYEYL